MIGVVDPDYRGQGIGRHLIDWQIERGRESLSSCDAPLPWYIRTQEFDWIEDSFRLYRRFGLEPVRFIKEMIRPLDPVVPRSVDGVEIVLWDRSLDEGTRERSTRLSGDHWGSTPYRRGQLSTPHPAQCDPSRLVLSGRLGWRGRRVLPERVLPRRRTGDGAPRRVGEESGCQAGMAWTRRRLGAARELVQRFPWRRTDALDAGSGPENPTGAFGLYEGLGYDKLHGTVILSARRGSQLEAVGTLLPCPGTSPASTT